jgi:hypothetical protein
MIVTVKYCKNRPPCATMLLLLLFPLHGIHIEKVDHLACKIIKFTRFEFLEKIAGDL